MDEFNQPQKPETFQFQVNLGGMLDVLSNHLYKSPDVFLRELLQNGVDAVTLRQNKQPSWYSGRITISVEPGCRIVFRDNGAGLTEPEIHRFLAVIGQSSKGQLVNGKLPEDYIGRFGIGLLSCFMVSDTIVIHTKSMEGGDAHIWTGYPDGTYTLEPLEQAEVGTAVILTAKPGAEPYYQREKLEELVRYYGLALPVPVFFAGETRRLNAIPSDFSQINRSQLLSFGQWLFQTDFLDAIPIQTPHLGGVAYVLPYGTDPSVKNSHRIYLKQMLLTEQGDMLLPDWAFFLRCFLNTRGLRPTASRENFYEDEELECAREEFAQAIQSYLETLAKENPVRLQNIVNVHCQAIKALAVWNDDLFRLFIDYLPFPTSEGTMTGAALKRVQKGCLVTDVAKFKKLKTIFSAQGQLLICTGYAYDHSLMEKLRELEGVPFEILEEDDMEQLLSASRETKDTERLLRYANDALMEFDCQAELRDFHPSDLPALYSMSEQVGFLREVQTAQESGGMLSGVLSAMLGDVEERPLTTLYLNGSNPLIQQLIRLNQPDVLESISRVLYVQALLADGQPLRSDEMKTLNTELLHLIRFGIDSTKS